MKRILQHVGAKDFRKTHQRKLDEKKVLYLERREREIRELEQEIIIKELAEPYKTDWRSEINEEMTTSDLVNTTLSSTGDEVISQVDGYLSTFASNGGSLSGTDLSYSAQYTDGVTVPVTYISGATYTYSRSASTNPIDTTRITQITIRVSKTSSVETSWRDNGVDYDDKISLGISGFGDDAPSPEDYDYLLSDDLTTGTYTFNIPSVLLGRTDVVLEFSQTAQIGAEGFPETATQGFTIFTPTFQRTRPVNVFVGLDEPEATSFIRTDPIMQGLSAQDRRKKLEDMLDAGDEYLLKHLGLQGSKARPADTKEIKSWEQAALPPGPKGYESPSSYDPKRIIPIQSPGSNWGKTPSYDLIDPFKGLEPTGPGLSKQGNQDTQIAGKVTFPSYPGYGFRGKYDQFGREIDPKTGKPVLAPMSPPVKGASRKNKVQIAHYEPQGQVISEKKLKSPKEVLDNKIPGYYDGKPAPIGFPIEPPPEMVNGMHPDLVDGKNVANRFNRLDPISAKAMPLTGNPHIDKKIKAARKVTSRKVKESKKYFCGFGKELQ